MNMRFRMALTAQCEYSNASRHFALDVHRHFEDELLDGVHGARLHDGQLILLGASRQVP